MAAFAVGNRVQFNPGCGEQGTVFVVEEVHSQPTPFGTFVTYVVRPEAGGEARAESNGHIRFRNAEEAR